jgi:hypothetical protein
MFELVWDQEITAENIVKVMKAIPSNFQSSFNYQLQGLAVCSAGFYSAVQSSAENWKLSGEYLDQGCHSWIKIVWFLVSFFKHPAVLVYSRLEGGKGPLNFLSSVECEKLTLFAARQDCALKSRKVEKNGENSRVSSVLSTNEGVDFESRRGIVSKSRTLPFETNDSSESGFNRNNRIELLEARLRSPGVSSGFEKFEKRNEGSNRDLSFKNEDYRTFAAQKGINSGKIENNWERSEPRRFDIGFRALAKEDGKNEQRFLEREEYSTKNINRENIGFRAQGKEDYSKNFRIDEYKPEAISRHQERETLFRPMPLKDEKIETSSLHNHHQREDYSLKRPEDFHDHRSEISNFSFTPSRPLRESAFDSRPEATSFKQRFSSVDRPALRGSYFRAEEKSSNDFERIDYRSKFQDQYQSFKEKYRFLDETSHQKPESTTSETFSKEDRNWVRSEVSKQQTRPVLRSNYDVNNSKSQDNLSQVKSFSRFDSSAGEDLKRYDLEETASNLSYMERKQFQSYQDSRPSREHPEKHEKLESSVLEVKNDQNDYLRNRSIDRVEYSRASKDPAVESKVSSFISFNADRGDKSSSSLSNYSKYLPSETSLNKSMHEPLRKKFIRNDFSSLTPTDLSSLKFTHEETKPEPRPVEILEGNQGKALRNRPVQNSSADWNCARCKKVLNFSAYECTECRLINWDQFYRVKSIQQPGDAGGVAEDCGKNSAFEEEADWVCSACSHFNKGLFFLCKSCRRPKNYVDR